MPYFAHIPHNGTIKCTHHFTNERTPITDHVPCSWLAEVWLVHRVRCMDLWIYKETKQTTLAPPTKLMSQRWDSGGRVCGAWTAHCPICFVQDKRTVSPSFHFSVFGSHKQIIMLEEQTIKTHLHPTMKATMKAIVWSSAQVCYCLSPNIMSCSPESSKWLFFLMASDFL